MDYRIKRVGQSDELEHALFGIGKKKSSSSSGSGSGQQGAKKGSTWSNHLYIARQKAGDGWRYFYSQAELKAAQAKQAGQKAAKMVGDTARKGLATVKRAGSKAADIASGKYANKIDTDYNRAREQWSHGVDSVLGVGSAADRKWTAHDKATKAKENAEAVTKDIARRDAELKEIEKVYGKNSEQYRVMKQDRDALPKQVNDYNEEADKEFTKKANADAAIDRHQKSMAEAESRMDAANAAKRSKAYQVSNAINKGKSAISKLIGDTKDAAEKAISTASDKAKNLADKGKNAIDALAKWRRDVSLSHFHVENPRKLSSTSTLKNFSIESPRKVTPEEAEELAKAAEKAGIPIKRTGDSSVDMPKNNRQYNGTSKKAEGDETRATKDMYKNSSDEYIEDLYFNSRKNDGSGVSKYLENEYNYRKAAQEANYLGRLTDSLSDDAEAALKKYGKNSDTYKRAYEKMEEAFDQLHEAELELARYEKNR